MGAKVKFATQVDETLLAKTRELAESEGRQIQALVQEALQDLITKRESKRMRPEVAGAYAKSVERFAELYQKLAQ